MQAPLPSRLPYPETRKDDVVETLHGTPVPDPYRWLEDPDAPGTDEWIAAQNELTFGIIRAGETRERLRERLMQVWDYPKYGVVSKEGGRYFFWKNSGLQNQAVLYVQDSLDGEPREVLDPNGLSEDGTAAVTAQSFTEDGRLMGYALSRSGSDWQDLRVRDVDGGADLGDVIQFCKFTRPAWASLRPADSAPGTRFSKDARGFFYSRFPEPGSVPPEQESFNQKVYWHALGTEQAADPLAYARPDAPELGFSPTVTDDGRYLVLHVWKGTDPKNRIYYAALDGGVEPGALEVVRLLDDADARYDFVDNVGSTLYFSTDLDAPRGRVIAIDLARPERANWREVIPEGAGSEVDTIDFVSMVRDHLVVATMHHAHHQVKLYTLEGAFVREVPLPGIGSIVGLSGKRTDAELFLAFTSFLSPTVVLRYDFS
ncbi:MAG TPA: S9 family peptidase, partial [Chloroflexota bacterium]|nr:S9 family peptidase [Chloroflexota bacterium]